MTIALDHPAVPACTWPKVLEAAVLADHLDRLYGAALALCGSREDAEELVREACLRVRSEPRPGRDEDVAHLFGALRSGFVSAGRRREPMPGLCPRAVHRTISALPAHQRDALIAVDILGLSCADAALALGVPAETIMSRLYDGRATLAARVGTPQMGESQ